MPSPAAAPVAAIIVAAGSGSRLGASVPKALVRIGGAPLVVHAADRLRAGGVDLLVVAAPEGHGSEFEAALAAHGAVVVVGGSTRQASVAAALAEVPREARIVLVHDAARAFAPSALVARVIAAVRAGHGAVVPVVPVTDTVVEVGSDDDGDIRSYADRSLLRAVQTPQGFDREVLVRAHELAAGRAGDESTAATDDASLVAVSGVPVWAVTGDDAAVKITRPGDLVLAETLAGSAGTGGARPGGAEPGGAGPGGAARTVTA